MILDKGVKIDAGVETVYAMIVLDQFTRDKLTYDKGLGWGQGIAYVMKDNTALFVYETETLYVIRKG